MDAPSEHRDQGQQDDPTDHRQQRAADQDEATTLGLAPWLGREPRPESFPHQGRDPTRSDKPHRENETGDEDREAPVAQRIGYKSDKQHSDDGRDEPEEEELAEPARRRVATSFRGSRPEGEGEEPERR